MRGGFLRGACFGMGIGFKNCALEEEWEEI